MFNDNGDRINAIYEIVNLKPAGAISIGKYDPFKSSVSVLGDLLIKAMFHFVVVRINCFLFYMYMFTQQL